MFVRANVLHRLLIILLKMVFFEGTYIGKSGGGHHWGPKRLTVIVPCPEGNRIIYPLQLLCDPISISIGISHAGFLVYVPSIHRYGVRALRVLSKARGVVTYC